MPTAGGFAVLGIFLFVFFHPASSFFCVFCCFAQGVRQLPAEVETAHVSNWKTRRLMMDVCFFRCLNSFDEEGLLRCIRLEVRLLQSHWEDLSPGLGYNTYLL